MDGFVFQPNVATDIITTARQISDIITLVDDLTIYLRSDSDGSDTGLLSCCWLCGEIIHPAQTNEKRNVRCMSHVVSSFNTCERMFRAAQVCILLHLI
mmetsp:Transcript_2377/g.3638  ORF Transcript_2377/g.3638 Transcript_2377/m.3638 type:complete len:98 (+) Transcript_2377:204-497(+)